MKIHQDFKEFIDAIVKNDVKFVIVGAYALAHHGYPRATGDIDIWLFPDQDNARRMIAALRDFGFESIGLSEADILSGDVIQLGYPPARIDILTKLEALDSSEIWSGKDEGSINGMRVFYIGLSQIIKNKKALGRHKDLADIEALGIKG